MAKRAETDTNTVLFFDISDLLWYFERARTPTGVQRIQTAIIEALSGLINVNLALCRFAPPENRWQEVSLTSFLNLLRLSRIGQELADPLWQRALRDVGSDLRQGTLIFPRGAVLVNLGTSWWLPNYFLQIRHLQVTRSIYYVPFIHDMIPIMAPTLCTTELVAEFIEWAIGVLYHADHFLTNSHASCADLIGVAATLGHNLPAERIDVLPLNADYRTGLRDVDQAEMLPSQLIGRQYVLLVSTIDVRKNQRAAFAVWRQLINKHELAAIPYLVIVGKPGFRGAEILEQLALDDALADRVVVLSDVSDAALATLYRHCLFTVYPSQYEGWGLPVTESLCYGKVPVVADNSSLREAGGSAAMYFRSGSSLSFLEQVERMIFDHRARKQQERLISEQFSPRSWQAVAAQLAAAIANFLAQSPVQRDRGAPPVVESTFYPIRRNQSSKIWPGMGAGEIFRLGVDWHEVETWGVWTRRAGGALGFNVGDGSTTVSCVKIAIHLRGLPSRPTSFFVTSGDSDRLADGELAADSSRWVVVDVPLSAGKATIWVRGDGSELLTDTGDERPREIGIGVRGFCVLPAGVAGRMMLVESLALQNMNDLNAYRRRGYRGDGLIVDQLTRY